MEYYEFHRYAIQHLKSNVYQKLRHLKAVKVKFCNYNTTVYSVVRYYRFFLAWPSNLHFEHGTPSHLNFGLALPPTLRLEGGPLSGAQIPSYYRPI